jgi:hypothetical protein
MFYIVIAVAVVLSIAATYTFGQVCWNKGYRAGHGQGRVEILEENLVRAGASILNNLKDDACIKLFDKCVPVERFDYGLER